VPPLAALLATLVAAPGPAHAGSPDERTGRLLVTLAPDADARATARAAGAALHGAHGDVAAVRVPAGASATALARDLRALPGVRDVRPERRYALRYVPDDPALSTPDGDEGRTAQWWLERQGFPAAWDRERREGVRVAVIDTGVDAAHPDLAGRIGPGADFDATPGHGPATVDEVGHGTHVASLACAQADNAIGLAGAGFGCTILPVKSDLSELSVVAALDWAVANRARVVVMSFGTSGDEPASPAVVRAIDRALARDVVLVAAAADEATGQQGDPANVLQPTGTGPDLLAGKGLSVTAADARDRRAPFAGFGTQISMAAYGATGGRPAGLLGAFPSNPTELESDSIFSAQPPCRCRTVFGGDPRYAHLQGTSMSAPVVAGAAALVRRLNPDLSAREVLRLLKETARNSAWDADTGWGILDAGAAVDRAAGLDRRAPASRLRRRPGRQRSTRIVLRVRASDPAPAGVRSSGVRSVDVLRSIDRGRYRRVARRRGGGRLVVRARPGQLVRLYTRATDRAGNREAPPRRPDVSVRVAR
jgi:subtilisin family serine protease